MCALNRTLPPSIGAGLHAAAPRPAPTILGTTKPGPTVPAVPPKTLLGE